jgi:hypothetical protein
VSKKLIRGRIVVQNFGWGVCNGKSKILLKFLEVKNELNILVK